MNTLDQPLSINKPEFDPAHLRIHFEHTFARILELRDALSAGTLDFASAESQAIDEQRVLSCASHACLLEALDEQLPETIIDAGEHFEPERERVETYTCLDGPVRVRRWVFASTRSQRKIVPMEWRAGLIQGQYTPRAAKVLLMGDADQDYRAAEQLRQTAGLLERSKSSAQRDITALAPVLDALDEKLEAARCARLGVEEEAVSMTVSVDRTGLPFEEALKRGPGRPKKGAPKNPCEVVRRQVYCACVSLVDARGEVLTTQRFGALPGQGGQLVEQASACVGRWLELHPSLEVVTVCDGAAEMKSLAREMLGEREPEAELVDAWHAMGYVRAALKAAGKPESWGEVLIGKLLKNKRGARDLLTRMRTWRIRTPSEELDKCITYFENHHERMHYAEARARGWSIGSGNVEATCKTVVAVRFKRSGARWKERGASPLLKVRALMASDGSVWDDAFDAFAATYVRPLAS